MTHITVLNSQKVLNGHRVPSSYLEHARHAARYGCGGQVSGLSRASLAPLSKANCSNYGQNCSMLKNRVPAPIDIPVQGPIPGSLWGPSPKRPCGTAAATAGAAGSRPLLLSRSMQMSCCRQPMGAAAACAHARWGRGGADLRPLFCRAPGPQHARPRWRLRAAGCGGGAAGTGAAGSGRSDRATATAQRQGSGQPPRAVPAGQGAARAPLGGGGGEREVWGAA